MVDINIPRFNQAFVAGLTAIAFVLQAWQVVAAVFLIVAATRLAGPKFGLFTQLYVRVLRPRLVQPIETEWSAPPRFAQLLAVIFLGIATVLFITGLTVAGWVVTLIVTALATLAATARICVGCIIYQRISDR
jgi:hypothetical protein